MFQIFETRAKSNASAFTSPAINDKIQEVPKMKFEKRQLTAKNINNFQKISFPATFAIFLALYGISAHFKFGDIDDTDVSTAVHKSAQNL